MGGTRTDAPKIIGRMSSQWATGPLTKGDDTLISYVLNI